MLGAQLGDLLQAAYAHPAASEQHDRQRFIAALKRRIHHARRHSLDSLLVTLDLPAQLDAVSRRQISELVIGQLRSLDQACQAAHGEATRLHVLLPLSGESDARAYRDRIARQLHERLGLDVSAAGIIFHAQAIDGSRSVAALLRAPDSQEDRHALA